MRIVALTAGASGMYCGACLRDNALAAELIRQKQEVLLVPLYTPTRPDEPNVSQGRVFFNGISLYLSQNFPRLGRLLPLIGGLLNSRRLLERVTARPAPVEPKLLGQLTVAMLEGRQGPLRHEVDKLIGWLKTQPAPEVIDLSYSLLAGLAQPLKEAFRCPLVCTLQGEDLFLEGLGEPYRSRALALIRAAVEQVDAFIVFSRYYAAFMSGYLLIPEERIHIVPLGINLEGHAPARENDGTFRVGYLARIAPEKGLHLLAEAYCLLRRRQNFEPAMLEAAGYLAPAHKGYLRQAGQIMRAHGLQKEFRYHGELDRAAKIRFLQSLDVLSVPSTYDEPRGLFVLEALANGVPVVEPARGALPEIIEGTQGGLLVEPDSAEALAGGIEKLWLEGDLRRRLAGQGCAAVREHYNIRRAAQATLEVYRKLSEEPGCKSC